MFFTEFIKQYSDDASALEGMFKMRFKSKFCPKCGAETKFYRVKKRNCFACKWCAYQIYPLVGTIFQNSHIALRLWLFVIYLFSTSKHGLSALEVTRHIGISYKTAFRMCHKIRKLMAQPQTKLKGTVEADEAYLGGKMIRLGEKRYWKNQSVILGAVQRNGEARAELASGANASTVIPFLQAKVEKNSKLYTDESGVYSRAHWYYKHKTTKHSIHEYAKGKVHSNTCEGFWSHMKRTLRGTYHGVSVKYLQSYINEAVWRHNYRDKEVYSILLKASI